MNTRSRSGGDPPNFCIHAVALPGQGRRGELYDIMSLLSRLSSRLKGPAPSATQTVEVARLPLRSSPLPRSAGPVKYLVREGGSEAERYPFAGQLEIGRDEDGRAVGPGLLLVPDPSISFRHCVISQTPDGACSVRDLSRNGTRLDGRRLVPNVETPLSVGQTLFLAPGVAFVLAGEATVPAQEKPVSRGRTEVAPPQLTIATVLVGDIRDYTVMVRKAPSGLLQQSVSRVFEALTAAVEEHGGTVKEFPGDAILAFWEGTFRGRMALSACRSALALDRVARRIALDPAIWALEDFPLRMDWALATGQVSIDSFGGATPVGLSMVGEPVVLACRLEKFATDQTGPILTCPVTRDMVLRATGDASAAELAGPALEFTDLGEMQAKGFDHPDHVFAIRIRDD